MKREFHAVILSMMIVLIALPSYAKFTFRPTVAVTEQYNDNIFLTAADEEDDLITTVSPGLKFVYSPNSALDFDLDYNLNFRYYRDNSGLDDTSIRDAQNIRFRTQARPLKRVFIDIIDTYERVPVDIRRSTAVDNAYKNMTGKNSFSVSPYVVFPLTAATSARAGYSYSNIWHSEEEPMDSFSNSGYVTLSTRFSSKMNASISYEHKAYRIEDKDARNEIDEYERKQGSAAITYQITPKFRFNAEGGRASTDFEREKDIDNTFWNTGVEYDLKNANRTKAGAEYGVSLNDSSLDGAFKSRRVDLRIETGRILRLMVNPYHSIDDYLNTDRKDRITGAAFEASRPLTHKITASFDGELEDQKFTVSTVDEKIRRYSLAVSFDYILNRKLSATLGYRYNRRDSDENTGEFKNNIAWLEARLTF